jgi:RimJ/RimL family protein N-acetyltransferase
MDAPDYVLEGERVALGPLRKGLADRYRRWLHDLEVRNGIVTVGVYALEAEEAWVEEAMAKCAGAQPELASFTVYDRSDGAPVGTAGLMSIDWRLSRATFGITIGERRGTGIGTETTRLTLDWAFNMLGLHNVMLTNAPEQHRRDPRLREGRLQAHRRAPRRPHGDGPPRRRGPHGRRGQRVRQPGAGGAPLI